MEARIKEAFHRGVNFTLEIAGFCLALFSAYIFLVMLYVFIT